LVVTKQPSRISLSLSFAIWKRHSYGKLGKKKEKKKGEPLYMLQSWAARDGQLRKSCVPYDV
jgi:hypothetical protein